MSVLELKNEQSIGVSVSTKHLSFYDYSLFYIPDTTWYGLPSLPERTILLILSVGQCFLFNIWLRLFLCSLLQWTLKQRDNYFDIQVSNSSHFISCFSIISFQTSLESDWRFRYLILSIKIWKIIMLVLLELFQQCLFWLDKCKIIRKLSLWMFSHILAHLIILYFVLLHIAQNFMMALAAVLFVSKLSFPLSFVPFSSNRKQGRKYLVCYNIYAISSALQSKSVICVTEKNNAWSNL